MIGKLETGISTTAGYVEYLYELALSSLILITVGLAGRCNMSHIYFAGGRLSEFEPSLLSPSCMNRNDVGWCLIV